MQALLQDAVFELTLPVECVGCGQSGAQRLCVSCTRGLPRGLWPMGPVEGLRSAWFFDDYGGPMGAALRRGKYAPDPACVDLVATHLAEAARSRLPRVDAVVPVAQTLWSTLRRGFSPVRCLGEGVATALDRPLIDALRRRHGPAQASLSDRERRANVQELYESRRPVAGMDLLLVDDVFTTGATARACAGVLLCAGARTVHLLVACRAR